MWTRRCTNKDSCCALPKLDLQQPALCLAESPLGALSDELRDVSVHLLIGMKWTLIPSNNLLLGVGELVWCPREKERVKEKSLYYRAHPALANAQRGAGQEQKSPITHCLDVMAIMVGKMAVWGWWSVHSGESQIPVAWEKTHNYPRQNHQLGNTSNTLACGWHFIFRS